MMTKKWGNEADVSPAKQSILRGIPVTKTHCRCLNVTGKSNRRKSSQEKRLWGGKSSATLSVKQTWPVINASSDLCVIRINGSSSHSAARRCECMNVKQSVSGNHACLTHLIKARRGWGLGGALCMWIGNQSLCSGVEQERLKTAHNYSTHRKQLLAFPAGTAHSALGAGARRCPLLWTVMVCSVFILDNNGGGNIKHAAHSTAV